MYIPVARESTATMIPCANLNAGGRPVVDLDVDAARSARPGWGSGQLDGRHARAREEDRRGAATPLRNTSAAHLGDGRERKPAPGRPSAAWRRAAAAGQLRSRSAAAAVWSAARMLAAAGSHIDDDDGRRHDDDDYVAVSLPFPSLPFPSLSLLELEPVVLPRLRLLTRQVTRHTIDTITYDHPVPAHVRRASTPSATTRGAGEREPRPSPPISPSLARARSALPSAASEQDGAWRAAVESDT